MRGACVSQGEAAGAVATLRGAAGTQFYDPDGLGLNERYSNAYRSVVAAHFGPVSEVLSTMAIAMDDLVNGQAVTIPVRPDAAP